MCIKFNHYDFCNPFVDIHRWFTRPMYTVNYFILPQHTYILKHHQWSLWWVLARFTDNMLSFMSVISFYLIISQVIRWPAQTMHKMWHNSDMIKTSYRDRIWHSWLHNSLSNDYTPLGVTFWHFHVFLPQWHENG